MLLWRSGPNTRTLPAILVTLPPSKAADMAHLCDPQNQALGVCRGFVPGIQVRGTHGREGLVNATTTSNAEEVSKIFLNIFVVCLTDSSPPSIMTSLVRISIAGVLLFFISFRVFLTSDVLISGISDEFELVFFSEGCWSWSVELYSSV